MCDPLWAVWAVCPPHATAWRSAWRTAWRREHSTVQLPRHRGTCDASLGRGQGRGFLALVPKDNHCERVLRTVCAPAVRRQACKRGGSESPRAVMRAESAAIRVQVSARGPTYPNCGPTTRLRPNACLSATKEAVPVQPSPRSRPGSNGGPPSLSFIGCQRARFPERFVLPSELLSVAARAARPWGDPGGRYVCGASVCLVVHLSCSWHIGHARPRACAHVRTWCAHRGHAQLTRPIGGGSS